MIRTFCGAAALWSLLGGAVSAQSVTLTARLRAEMVVRLEAEVPEQPLPLVEERLRAVVDAQHATTTLTQVFRNTTGGALEGRYILRPSMDARVQGFAYYIGERRIEGEVLERVAARRVYDEVTTQRRDPAILEQTADGELTFRVFPIAPREDKRIEITFSEWLERRGSTVTYRVPLGPESDAEILLRDRRIRDVRSTTHAITVEPDHGGLRVRARGLVEPRGELVLRWRIEEPAWQPSVYIHRDAGHEAYFALALAAPEEDRRRAAAKDVTIVLDRSGSMGGAAIEHARAAAADVIRRLGVHDRLNVVAFDDDVIPLFEKPRPADVRARTEALDFVSNLHVGGGTDIALALTEALSRQDDASGRPRVVIFLTDGQSPSAPALMAAERDARDVRLFTVGLGTGVNRALLSRLAATKRGSFTYIDQADAVEAEVGHLYAQIAAPLLVDVSLEIEGAVASRLYPRSLPDLFVDSELLVTGRLRGEGPVRFVVRGSLGGEPIEVHASALVGERHGKPWVGRRWAISRVDHLLEEIALAGEKVELRSEVVSLALAYDFVTPYTAFLAIPPEEVTAGAEGILGAAREQRLAAQARHADGAALTGGGADMEVAHYAAEPAHDEHDAPMAAPSADRAGCASCAVGAGGLPPPLAWVPLTVLGALVVLRRRS